jgi:phenylacetate-CoA ligase
VPTREALERVVERVRQTPLGARIPADWEDLTDLPFTVKEDLREHYPLGLVTVPHDELRRIHASSGSRGKPTVVAYNQHDLDVWSEVMAYCMTMAGVKPGMVVHNAYGYGLFTGGLGFHQGAERIGALTIPVSGGVTARQALLLRDLQGQVLCSTPSYALHIAQGIREAGLGPDDLDLQIGLFGAEP